MGVILGKTTEQANIMMIMRAIAGKYGCILHDVNFEERVFDLRGNDMNCLFKARDEIMVALKKTKF